MVDTGIDMGADALEKVPIAGQIVSGARGAYHLGSAGYDLYHGDRDGAIAHGVQGAFGILDALPATHEMMQTLKPADDLIAQAGMGVRLGMEVNGIDSGDVPTGVDDVASGVAVAAANAIFGEDKDKGDGTRQGEIGAGLGAVGALCLSGGNPLMMAANAMIGNELGNAIGSVTSPNEPTSGAEPGAFAQAGQWVHDLF
jgi:hypothetical protein